MTGSNVDIFRPEWLNVIFAGRNQAYGAYELRKSNARTTNMAMAMAIGSFVLLLAVPTIVSKIRGPVIEATETITPVDLTNKIYQAQPPPEDQKKVETKTVSPKNDIIKDLPPVVKADGQDEPPTDKQLIKADPGQVNIKGHDDGNKQIDETPSDKGKAGAGGGNGTSPEGPLTDRNAMIDIAGINPEYPGGEAAFARFLQKNIRYPEIARESSIQGKVYLQFIVERDGSLTDIEILREPGGGTGREAARVLKLSPHWKPGVQNGKPVRVRYTIPISFNLGDQN